MSIPNVDDYERIEDIEDVRTGDLVVSVSGNWYTVRADMTSAFKQLYCTIGGDAENGESPLFFFDPEKFDYALREKIHLPDKPGLWKDKDGDIWLYSTYSTGIGDARVIRQRGTWVTGGESFTFDKALVKAYAPFTPCKLEESC